MWENFQREHFIDDRDLSDYYRNLKQERFVHLRQDTVKLIVYSHCEQEVTLNLCYTKLDYDYSDSRTPIVPRVIDSEAKVRKGMNVVCFCRLMGTEDWPEKYERFCVEVRGSSKLLLHPTPELYYTWQAVELTDGEPLSLADTSYAAIGFHYLRREGDAKQWEIDDPWVKRIQEHRETELAQFRLTLPQKMLLMYNNTRTKGLSCWAQFRGELGHEDGLNSDVPFYMAFDWDFVLAHKLDRYAWYEQQWCYMLYAQYWTSPRSTHEIYDFREILRDCGEHRRYNHEY